MKKYLTYNQTYIDVAKRISDDSTCLKARCGSVLVKDGIIISTGCNGASRKEESCKDCGACAREGYKVDRTNYVGCKAIHAEINCLSNLLITGCNSVVGTEIYAYYKRMNNDKVEHVGPCEGCMKFLKNVGVQRIYNLIIDNHHTVENVIEL